MTVRLSGPPRHGGLPSIDRRLLRSRAQATLRALAQTRSELSVVLVADDEMARLNSAYRRRAGATDVLAFPLAEGEGAQYRGKLLGDVVISVETAAKQARARHRALDDELARLLVHGTLHLLGYDHQREEEARAMRAEERRLWKTLRELP